MCGGGGAKLGLDITGYEEKKRQANLAAEAQDRATKAAQEAAKVAEEQAAQQAAMQTNFATDLSRENLGTVVAGGSAEQSVAADMKKPKKRVSGLSSALGINV
jgi:hypothetical protein